VCLAEYKVERFGVPGALIPLTRVCFAQRDRNKEANELGAKHAAWLQEELDIKQKELQEFRTDKNTTQRELQQKADDSAEEAAKLAGQIGSLRARAEEAEAKLGQQNSELEEKTGRVASQEEAFQSELAAKSQLASAYKEAKDDAEVRVRQLTTVLSELQEQLAAKQAKHAAALEVAEGKAAGLAEQVKELTADLAAAVTATAATANAAAAAAPATDPVPSASARGEPARSPSMDVEFSGRRLSEVYSEHVVVKKQLREAELEKKRLNNYLESILAELEQKAPMLAEQHAEFERAIKSHGRITLQLQEEKQTVLQLQKAKRDLEAELAESGQQHAGLLRTTEALSLQVQRLEASRGSGAAAAVPSLQEQNRQLLTKVHGLEAELEKTSLAATDSADASRRGQLQNLIAEVEQLRANQARSEEMVKAIVHQRDVYKELLRKDGTLAPGTPAAAGAAAAVSMGTASDYEALKHQAEEFELYKAEQQDLFKVLEGKLEATQRMEAEARAKLSMAETKADYEQERYGRLQETLNSKRDEVVALETKHQEYRRINTELRQQMEVAQQRISAAGEAGRRTEAELSNANANAKAEAEAGRRLVKERETLGEELRAQSTLYEAMQVAEGEARERLEARERTVNAEQKRQAELLTAAKEAAEVSRQKATVAETAKREVEQQLATAKTEATAAEEQAKAALDKQEAAEHKLAEAAVGGGPAPAAAAVATVRPPSGDADGGDAGVVAAVWVDEKRKFELRLVQLETDLEHARNELKEKEQEAADMRAIANIDKQTIEDLQTARSNADAATERRAAELETAKKQAEAFEVRGVAAKAEAVEKLRVVETERDGLKNDVAAKEGVVERGRLEVSQQQAIVAALQEEVETRHKQWREAQDNYMSEVQKHARTMETLQSVQRTVDGAQSKATQAGSEVVAAKAELVAATAAAKQHHDALIAQVAEREEELTVARAESAKLREQLESSASVYAFGRRASVGSEPSMGVHHGDYEVETTDARAAAGVGAASSRVEEVRQLSRRVNVLSAELESKSQALQRVQTQSEHRQKELVFAKSKLREELEKRSRVDISEAELADLSSKAEQYGPLSDSNKLLRQESEGHAATIESQHVELEARQQKIDELEQAKRAAKAVSKSAAASAAKAMAEAGEWRTKMQASLDKNKEYERLQSEIASMRGKADQADALTAKLAAVTAKLEAETGKLVTLGQQITTVCAQLGESQEFKKSVAEIVTEVAVLQPIAKELNRRGDTAKRRYDDALKFMKQKKEVEATAKTTVASKEAEFAAKVAEVDTLTRQLSERPADAPPLGADVVLDAGAVGTGLEELRKAQAEVEQVKAKMQSTLQTLRKVLQDNRQLKSAQAACTCVAGKAVAVSPAAPAAPPAAAPAVAPPGAAPAAAPPGAAPAASSAGTPAATPAKPASAPAPTAPAVTPAMAPAVAPAAPAVALAVAPAAPAAPAAAMPATKIVGASLQTTKGEGVKGPAGTRGTPKGMGTATPPAALATGGKRPLSATAPNFAPPGKAAKVQPASLASSPAPSVGTAAAATPTAAPVAAPAAVAAAVAEAIPVAEPEVPAQVPAELSMELDAMVAAGVDEGEAEHCAAVEDSAVEAMAIYPAAAEPTAVQAAVGDLAVDEYAAVAAAVPNGAAASKSVAPASTTVVAVVAVPAAAPHITRSDSNKKAADEMEAALAAARAAVGIVTVAAAVDSSAEPAAPMTAAAADATATESTPAVPASAVAAAPAAKMAGSSLPSSSVSKEAALRQRLAAAKAQAAAKAKAATGTTASPAVPASTTGGTSPRTAKGKGRAGMRGGGRVRGAARGATAAGVGAPGTPVAASPGASPAATMAHKGKGAATKAGKGMRGGTPTRTMSPGRGRAARAARGARGALMRTASPGPVRGAVHAARGGSVTTSPAAVAGGSPAAKKPKTGEGAATSLTATPAQPKPAATPPPAPQPQPPAPT
jgi:nucleoprotein TPR